MPVNETGGRPICTAVLALATVGLAVATIGLWFATGSLVHYADKQAGDMDKSLKIAADAVTAAKDSALSAKISADAASEANRFNMETSKPTITVDSTQAATNLIITQSGINVRIKFTLRNSGKLVANNVAVVAEMDLEGRTSRRDARVAQEAMCRKAQAESEASAGGSVVSPGIDDTRERRVSIGAKDVQVGTRIESLSGKKFVVPLVFGCVYYVALSEPRFTGFKIEFSVAKDVEEGTSERFYLADGSIDAGNIFLVPNSSYSK